MMTPKNGPSIRAIFLRLPRITRRLCLAATLVVVAALPARAQDNFDFTYSGSGISVGNTIVASLADWQTPRELVLRALTDERNGAIERAQAEYDAAVRRSNFDPRITLGYAAFLQRHGKNERAEDFLVALSKKWPRNPNVLTALAQVALTRKDWRTAKSMVKVIRDIGDPGRVAYQIEAAVLIGRNRIDDAIAIYQAAAKASPDSRVPMALLVDALVKAKKTDQALAVLKMTLKANPKNATAWMLKGQIQLASGLPDQARHSFEQTIAAQPDDVGGYGALAELDTNQHKFDDAVAVVQSGLRRQPGNMVLQLSLAGIYEHAGRYEAAIGEYETMLHKQPDSLIAANNLASLLADHRTDKASLQRAQSLAARLKASPVPQFKDTVGWIEYRSAHYKEATALLRKAAAALPDHAGVRYHLGMSLLATGEATQAGEQFKAALALAPDATLAKKIHAALKKLPG